MGVFQKRGKRGKRYYIDYYVDGKRVRECVGDVPRKLAEDTLKVRQAEIVQGKYQLKSKVLNPTFQALCQDYRDYLRPRREGKALDTYENRLKRLEPFFGKYRLSQISPFLIEKYIRERRSQRTYRKTFVSAATVNRELQVFKRMFNLAIQWKKAQANPVREVKFLKEERKPDRVLTQEEEDKRLASSASHVRMAVVLALHTGMRLGKVLGLAWSDINLRENFIMVVKAKGSKTRSIPINRVLREALLEFRKPAGKGTYLFFNDRTGKPIQAIKTGFVKAVRRAGIPHCCFHDLRHTFATRLVLAGVDLATVSELLGHSSIEMTMRYAHPSPENRRRAVELLSDRHYLDTSPESTDRRDSAKLLNLQSMRP